MNQLEVRFVLVAVIAIIGNTIGFGQTTIPQILIKGSISEQMNYIETSTRIYENYRAIREDMFQIIKNNSVDSLIKAKNRINGFVLFTDNLNRRIDSLKASLEAAKLEMEMLSTTKNSIHVIGLELNKAIYNSIMWTIVAVMAALLIIGFLTFKQSLSIHFSTKKDLQELKSEFEEYRQKTRIEREKVSMDHFNEIKKLKGR
jgi:hypothetical protein